MKATKCLPSVIAVFALGAFISLFGADFSVRDYGAKVGDSATFPYISDCRICQLLVADIDNNRLWICGNNTYFSKADKNLITNGAYDDKSL